MGTFGSKTYSPRHNSTVTNTRNHYIGFSQFSLASFVENLSGRSIGSVATRKTVSSISRPWSRISRCRWHDSTLTNPFESAKTAWPVPFIEACFLPDFKIGGSVSENSFEIVGVISKGAFGKVFRVQLKENGKDYAMKVLKKSKIIQERCIEQVKDEVKIQSMCGHNPFLVSCLFYWQNKRELFIVTDYLDGGDLYTLCDNYGALPEELCRLYVAELALALDFLHNAGVIYRDLKLENVLLDTDGHVMLIDFGLAKWLNYGDRTNTLCGTLQYMAPEIFHSGSYGHAVDWWALGVLACYLLTSTFAEGGNKECAGKYPQVESVPVRDLLGRLLELDPSKRLRSLLVLQTIPFFMGFSFADVRGRKMRPRDILNKHFPDKRDQIVMKESNVLFYDFDSMSPSLV